MSASLDGHRALGARLQIAAAGVWWAEAGLDIDVPVSGRVSLVLADLTLSGTIVSGGTGPSGRSSYRIAAGRGRWGAAVPAKGYANDAGVKASTVLLDAAAACGETIDAATLPTLRLGPAWTREAGPAARALEQIAPGAWYVDLDGVTRFGKRAAHVLTAPSLVSSVDRSRGVVHMASESLVDLLPGVTVEGIEAVDVMHEVSTVGIRTTLWGRRAEGGSRELVALRRLLEQLDPDRRFRGAYEYRVVTQEGERLSLQPVRMSIGMPELQRVPVRPGIAGARANVKLGERVLVTFADCDPARPVVIAHEDAEGDGFVPLKLELDATAELDLGASALLTKIAGGTLPVARQTDPVIAGPFGGTITVGSLKARCG